MRANIWTGMCAAIVSAATVGAFAQAPQQTTTPQHRRPQAAPAPAQAAPSSSDRKKTTVTGCLKAAPHVEEASSAA